MDVGRGPRTRVYTADVPDSSGKHMDDLGFPRALFWARDAGPPSARPRVSGAEQGLPGGVGRGSWKGFQDRLEEDPPLLQGKQLGWPGGGAQGGKQLPASGTCAPRLTP